MSARNIVESPRKMILAQIKTNIAAALAAVRTDRDDPIVNTELPPDQSYFTFSGAKAYRKPAIFVVAQEVDFKLDRGQNFIDGTIRFIVSVVVEEKNQTLLTVKADRYLDALHSLLQGIEIVDEDNKTKIVISVMKARFSEDFAEKPDVGMQFTKEVAFDCDVEIYQQL